MKKFNYITLMILLFVSYCNAQTIVKGKDGKDIVTFDPQNSTMNEAMIAGQNTIKKFLKIFNNKQENQIRFSVKVKMSDDSNTEYLWLDELDFSKEGVVKGLLLNKPYYFSDFNIGDPLTMNLDKIVDWSYIEGGYLIGGFTLRVMFEKYSPDQKIEIQKQLGYRIDANKGI